MNEETSPQGEFHQFQLVNSDGDIPLSISLFVHWGAQNLPGSGESREPITANDIITFHEAIKDFDGDYIKAFRSA